MAARPVARRLLALALLAAPVVACVPDPAPAPDNGCRIELRSIRTALEAYRAVNGAYPTTLAPLVGDYLADPVDSSRFVYDPDGAGYVLVGVGDCAGVTA